MRRESKDQLAFTLIEFVCVVAILLLIGSVVLPFFAKSKSHPRRIKCVNNLKNIGLANRIWATDNGDHFPFEISTNSGGTLEINDVAHQFRFLSNELSTPKILVCPKFFRTVSASTNWAALDRTNITYYLDLNAIETNRDSILAGDTGISINGKPAENGHFEVTPRDQLAYPRTFHTDGDGANILTADGSVQILKPRDWQKFLTRSGNPTNHLLLP